jgi:hypothetical protein
MGILYGIDCTNKRCIHDSVKGYRLRLSIRRSTRCTLCGRDGNHLSPDDWQRMGRRPQAYKPDWHICQSDATQWRARFERERNDLIFQPNQLDAALAQMRALGVGEPAVGNWIVRENDTPPPPLPPGYDARLAMLSNEPLPRIAVYFFWKPESGELLTPEKIFQMAFHPDMTAAERKAAPMRRLTEQQCRELVQYNPSGKAQRPVDDSGNVDSGWARNVQVLSTIHCQHCQEALPLRTFSTLTLREVALGD